jgi:hypothetical protein
MMGRPKIINTTKPRAKHYLHHGLNDPSELDGSDEEKTIAFRHIRDNIKQWIIDSYANPKILSRTMVHDRTRFRVDQAATFKYDYNITVFVVIVGANTTVIELCKEEAKCKYRNDMRGCTLKHISEARKLIAKGKYKEADLELSYTEGHVKET